MMVQHLVLTWCNTCECYSCDPAHSCEQKLAQRRSLEAHGPERVERRSRAAKKYQDAYRAHCAEKRAERRR